MFNKRLAQQLGAAIETSYGDDVPYQIAEFARLSGISKIVIGRSTIARKNIFSKPTLTERLISSVPNLDIHVIPDASTGTSYQEKKSKAQVDAMPLRDVLKSIDFAVLWGVLHNRKYTHSPANGIRYAAIRCFTKEPHRGDNYFTLFVILALQRKKQVILNP